MKRKVKKTLAFLLALTLMVSLMGKDRLFVAAETQSAETESIEEAFLTESAREDNSESEAQDDYGEQLQSEENSADEDGEDVEKPQENEEEKTSDDVPEEKSNNDTDEEVAEKIKDVDSLEGASADGEKNTEVKEGNEGETKEKEEKEENDSLYDCFQEYMEAIEAFADEADTIVEQGEDEGQRLAACEDLYNRLMKIYSAAMDNKNLTEEEKEEIDEAIAMVVTNLIEQYGYDPYGVTLLVDDRWPGGGGNELNPGSYRNTAKVYWDVMNANENGSSSGGSQSSTNIDSVSLNDIAVQWGNSNNTTWAGGNSLSTYYPNASTNNMDENGTLIITPAVGYYVTKIVIACTGGGRETPYNCHTWAEGNAFTTAFSVGTSGAVTVKNLSSVNFSHSSSSSNYFILIKVAPVPSPLYVEYDYGNIGELFGAAGKDLNDTAFVFANGWTNGTPGNEYGTGEVQTDYTQYQYKYAEDSSAATDWKHYANIVTHSAKEDAAKIGYYFAGWEADYYTSVTATQNSGSSYNNYSYVFSNEYGTASYGEGENVPLITNVKLTAQWKPIELKVTKTVEGLENTVFANESHSYTLQLQKWDDSANDWVEYQRSEHSIIGDASSDRVFSAVPSGKYRVIETLGNENLTNGETTMYISVSDGLVSESAVTEITVNDIEDGKTSFLLQVTNSYSENAPGASLTVKKEVTGVATSVAVGQIYKFTVQAEGSIKDVVAGQTFGEHHFDTDGKMEVTITMSSDSENAITISGLPEGDYTVTESVTGDTYVSADGKLYCYTGNNGPVSVTMAAGDICDAVVTNNYAEVSPPTGIFTNHMPYILMMMFAAFMFVGFFSPVLGKRKEIDR